MNELKNKLNSAVLAAVVTTAAAMGVLSSNAQTGEELFKQNCGACHKLGGKMVGPDLVGVSSRRSPEWIASFIKSSQTMVKAGDADAVAIFNEFNQVPMPDQSLTDDQIKLVVGYLDEKGAEIAASKPAEAPADAAPAPEVTYAQEDIDLGKALFDGSTRFENGGPSCISCHNASNKDVMAGGLLAKDLTNVFGRMGEAGLGGILSSPPFPAMASSYGNNKLTEGEIKALTAFFHQVDKQSVESPVVKSGNRILPLFGGIGFIVLLGLIYFHWSYRKRLSVKHDIYERQRR